MLARSVTCTSNTLASVPTIVPSSIPMMAVSIGRTNTITMARSLSCARTPSSLSSVASTKLRSLSIAERLLHIRGQTLSLTNRRAISSCSTSSSSSLSSSSPSSLSKRHYSRGDGHMGGMSLLQMHLLAANGVRSLSSASSRSNDTTNGSNGVISSVQWSASLSLLKWRRNLSSNLIRMATWLSSSGNNGSAPRGFGNFADDVNNKESSTPPSTSSNDDTTKSSGDKEEQKGSDGTKPSVDDSSAANDSKQEKETDGISYYSMIITI